MAKSDSHKIPKWLKLEEGEEYICGYKGWLGEWEFLHYGSVISVPLVLLMLAFPPNNDPGLFMYYLLLSSVPILNLINTTRHYYSGRIVCHVTTKRLFLGDSFPFLKRHFDEIRLEQIDAIEQPKWYMGGSAVIRYTHKGKPRRFNISVEDRREFVSELSALIDSTSELPLGARADA